MTHLTGKQIGILVGLGVGGLIFTILAFKLLEHIPGIGFLLHLGTILSTITFIATIAILWYLYAKGKKVSPSAPTKSPSAHIDDEDKNKQV